MSVKQVIFITGLFFIPLVCAFAISTTTVSSDKETNISITIYNNNLALIKDTRKIHLPAGRSRLIFENVSKNIQPETVSLTNLNKKNPITIIEQNFYANLLTPKKLLESYLNNDIKIIRTNPVTGQETAIRATVLSTYGGIILQIGNHIETGMPSRIQFPSLPEGLNNIPTLSIELTQAKSDLQTLTLNYLTGGLSWKADYVANINKDETHIDLSAWVTLSNNSGVSYKNTKIQLIAGNVNQTQNNRISRQTLSRNKTSKLSVINIENETLLDYQLYSLEQKTDLLNGQTKQVALINRTQIPIKKEYVFQGIPAIYHIYHDKNITANKIFRPDIKIKFTNNKKSNLALTLPSGIIRSYKNDQDGHSQFVGSAAINHTAVNETISLTLGKALGISGHKKQLTFQIKSKNNRTPVITEAEYEFTFKNNKNTDIKVLINEPIPGDWTILSSTHKPFKTDLNMAQWNLPIKANDKTVLRYKVKIVR